MRSISGPGFDSPHLHQGATEEPSAFSENLNRNPRSQKVPSVVPEDPPVLTVVFHRPVPTTTTSTVPPTTTTTLPPEPPTLAELIGQNFEMEDWAWALKVAFCESSAQPEDVVSKAVHKRSGASGWFQHLPKFWEYRTEAAGIPGADIMDPVANVEVAAYLLYQTPQGKGHWYPSEHCWG